jgi:hypothetical protein
MRELAPVHSPRIQLTRSYSESRRENSLVGKGDQNSMLHTVYKQNGEISESFPKTLMALMTMDGEIRSFWILDAIAADSVNTSSRWYSEAIGRVRDTSRSRVIKRDEREQVLAILSSSSSIGSSDCIDLVIPKFKPEIS